MPSPTAAPAVSSTVGLKNLVIAPVTADTEESTTYGDPVSYTHLTLPTILRV